jgi:prophage regulatory protein
MTPSIPETGFLRLKQILGDPAKNIPALIPVSRTTWFRGIKSGRYPRPCAIGARAVAWRADDIRKLISEVSA